MERDEEMGMARVAGGDRCAGLTRGKGGLSEKRTAEEKRR